MHNPASNSESTFPTGTVTFLFTDIEGSTHLWQEKPQAMAISLAQHDAILRATVESSNGKVIKTTGDGVHACFSNALDSVQAALVAQIQFQAPLGVLQIKVRMGVYTGESELRAGDYYGPTLNRAARLMTSAHGGQILLSSTTAELLRDQLPGGASLRDLGEHRLKDLNRPEHIFQLVHPDLPEAFPPIQTIDAFPNNLPVQLTSFIGREKEMGEISDLLNSARLVTLTGSGGTGKTRLSLEVGAQVLGSYAHGVWLIELAPLADPIQIIPAIAKVFGLQELPFTPLADLVTDYLREKQLLLLLDNCEHLIEACARLADDLLHQCKRLKILASSREGLGIAGEMAYRIPSLVVTESTQLFIERARAVNLKFSLSEANAASIAKICARLDGIPLAIELAAARTKLLSVEQIATRLDDRFRLLVGGSRTALPRQQTLRAMIDWSYDLLCEAERKLLQAASVFVGGWTLEALEFVAEDPNALENLDLLVNKSLVVAEQRETEMRYFMLETIRQYAREKLFDSGQVSKVRDRQFAYFDSLADKLGEMFTSPDALSWREKVDDELENMRAALDWGMEHDPDTALRLATNFCLVSVSYVNVTEALGLLKSALDRVRSLPPVSGEAAKDRQNLIARALFAQGNIGMGGTGFPQVLQSLQEAAAISRLTGNKKILGYSLEVYFIASQFNNAPDGPAAAEEGLAVLSEINDRWGVDMAYLNMIRVASIRGDLVEKQKYLEIVKQRSQHAPLATQTGFFYLGMGFDERRQGNLDLAKQYYEDGLDVFRKIRSKHFESVLLSELGHVARLQHHFTRAKEIYTQTILSWQELGARPAIAHELECFAFVAIGEEEPEHAAKLMGAAEILRENVQSPMTYYERVEYDQFVVQLRSMLSESEFSSLWAQGRALTMDQAVQLTLSKL